MAEVDPFIKSLNMKLSEAEATYGSYVMVAIDISNGYTTPNRNYLQVLVNEKKQLEKSLKDLNAIVSLVEKNVE